MLSPSDFALLVLLSVGTVHAAFVRPAAVRTAGTHRGSEPVMAATLSLEDEVLRRRNLAIISHPDAGKTTLTEKVLSHALSLPCALLTLVSLPSAPVSYTHLTLPTICSV